MYGTESERMTTAVSTAHKRTNPASSHHASVPHGLFKAPVPLPAGHGVPRHVITTVPHPIPLPKYS